MNKNEQRKGGKGLGRGGEAACNTQAPVKWIGCVAQSICFRQSLWRSAKQADSFQVSSTLKKKGPPHYRRDVEIM